MAKLVVIIQCEHALKRCCGFWCTKDFYERLGAFQGYPEDTQYMTFSCGGCCGRGLAAKVENLSHRLEVDGRDKGDVVVHFGSCVCTDNHHHTPCPFQNIMETILQRHGFTNIVKGTHISKKAQKRRDEGLYRG
jgi:predicted metal-binding protein